MQTMKVDGILFEKMVRSARNNIYNFEEEVNALNVFPVADGDTGTNMRLTIENGIRTAKTNANLGAYLKELGDGMLLGARGNSGVILSQIFYGFSQALLHYSSATPANVRNALIRGYKTAYSTVIHPVEGTMLTVSREGVENIKNQIDRNTTLESFLSMFIAEMKKSLQRTPDLLDVLKEAGVVDSGAYGLIIIFEGMLKFLYGEEIKADGMAENVSEGQTMYVPSEESLKFFDGNTPFEDGYCMEFLLQLMKSSDYSQAFHLKQFIKDLEDCGNSIVCVQNGTRIKVHIHTKRPAKIIMLAQSFGEFLAFKLENMQLQHNEHIDKLDKKKEKPSVKVPIAFVAVADGEGIRSLFEELKCTAIIDGGQSMNTSAQEFVDAFEEISADRIVVLPNNKNIVRAAEQAVTISGLTNVTVIPTETMVEGYYALAMDIGDEEDLDIRMNAIKEGAEYASSMLIATASKEYEKDDLHVNAGDMIAVADDEVIYASESILESTKGGLALLEDIEDKESCLALYGQDVSEDEVEEMVELFEDEFPDIELTVLPGGQHVYSWIFGLV